MTPDPIAALRLAMDDADITGTTRALLVAHFSMRWNGAIMAQSIDGDPQRQQRILASLRNLEKAYLDMEAELSHTVAQRRVWDSGIEYVRLLIQTIEQGYAQ